MDVSFVLIIFIVRSLFSPNKHTFDTDSIQLPVTKSLRSNKI